VNGSERSGSALSYVTDRSVRAIEGVQGLEVVTLVLPIDKGRVGVEAEVLLAEPTPEPVPSSEEEEDEKRRLWSRPFRYSVAGPRAYTTSSGQRLSLVGLCATLLTVRNP